MMTLSHDAGGSRHFLALDLDLGMRFNRSLHRLRKTHAIDRERATRRQLVGVGRAHDQRTQPPHLLVQQPDRVVLPIVGAERIRTHEFGQALAGVRFGHPAGPHLVQHDAAARLRRLPCRFASREAPADDVDCAHRLEITRNG